MSTVCVSNCPGDVTRSQSFPIPRASHESHNWPEFDGSKGRRYFSHSPQVANSASCRQFYVRNGYSFSMTESAPEKTKNCFGKIKDKMTSSAGSREFPYSGRGYRSQVRARSRSMMVKRVKEFPLVALRSIVQRLLSCTTSVDVVEHK